MLTKYTAYPLMYERSDKCMLFVLLNVIYCLIVTKQTHYTTTTHKSEQDNVDGTQKNLGFSLFQKYQRIKEGESIKRKM